MSISLRKENHSISLKKSGDLNKIKISNCLMATSGSSFFLEGQIAVSGCSFYFNQDFSDSYLRGIE